MADMKAAVCGSSHHVQRDNYVILKRGNACKVFQVNVNKPIYFCKQSMHLEGLIGKPFGSKFEIQSKKLKLIEDCASPIEVRSLVNDNRDLLDDGKSQKLTREQIEELKQQGTASNEIVRTIVENSSTFKEKTQFSQEKYVKKKESKYDYYVTVLRPNIRLLTEMYFNQGPMKICNMRIDTLSQMLNTANIHNGGRYLVVDDCLGLLAAAVLNRIGNDGKVIQICLGQGPNSSARQAVSAMNFKADVLNNLLGISYAKIVESESISKENSVINGDEPMGEFLDPVKKQQFEARVIRRLIRQKETESVINMLKDANMDSFLIACKHNPTLISLHLLRYLNPSRPFAIYSMYQQPLIECYKQLKTNGEAIFMKLSESWLRKYQVLDERTHPEINMSNTGGYLLTGIKVEPI